MGCKTRYDKREACQTPFRKNDKPLLCRKKQILDYSQSIGTNFRQTGFDISIFSPVSCNNPVSASRANI